MHHQGANTGTREGLAPPGLLLGAPRIWALGGGKGGVGKSVVASSLACAIAGNGRRCAIIDADLGGANLHTLLGVARPRRTLSHFLDGEVESLEDLMLPTSVRNLSLVAGNEALVEMANPKNGQKEKLLRHIRGLDVDEVILDLGAGSAFNVLDFFLVAERRLVVVTPEPTAIENAEHFLRAAFHRSLRAVARRPEVRAAILRLQEDRRGRLVASARELIARIKQLDPPAAKLLEECAASFAPLLLVNQVETPEHLRVGPALAESCRQSLGVAIEYAGALDRDASVREAVARQRPTVQLFSHCAFSRHIEELAKRLLRDECRVPRELELRSDFDRTWGGSQPATDRQPSRAPATATRALPALDLAEPGAYLRLCREQLGFSLAEMTERTRIRGLDDIEGERFGALPPEPYLKGFVLEYARELGVSELEALTARYLDRYRGVDAPAAG